MAAGVEMHSGLSYFCPRILLPLPHDLNWYETKILPRLGTWRQQSAGRGGDNTICADHFLNHIVPYFVRILVQDGVFFIKEFPNHPLVHMLKVSTTTTNYWAAIILCSNTALPCYSTYYWYV